MEAMKTPISRRSSSICKFHHHRRTSVLSSKSTDPTLQIQDINCQVAQFRDLLINIGQSRDGPELRERVRKLRRNCVEACKHTSQLVLPQMRSAIDLGIPADSPNLVLLFFVAQLFLRELHKCKNLVRIVPMDMSDYYASKSGPSNIGNVISSILLCKPITPNFNEEELCSIRKDSSEISALVAELQEFMPQSEADRNRLHCKTHALVQFAPMGPARATGGTIEVEIRIILVAALIFFVVPQGLTMYKPVKVPFSSIKTK